MQKEECWKNFLTSGKVTDYLSYCRAAEETSHSGGESGGNSVRTGEDPEDKRKHNAGFF